MTTLYSQEEAADAAARLGITRPDGLDPDSRMWRRYVQFKAEQTTNPAPITLAEMPADGPTTTYRLPGLWADDFADRSAGCWIDDRERIVRSNSRYVYIAMSAAERDDAIAAARHDATNDDADFTAEQRSLIQSARRALAALSA